MLETKAAKGRLLDSEMEDFAQKVADFKEESPLRLYVDDVTTKKDSVTKRTKVGGDAYDVAMTLA